MATPTHLLQVVPNQKPFVYNWTPNLAKKKGMKPITAEQAQEFAATGMIVGIYEPDKVKPKPAPNTIPPIPEFVSGDDLDEEITDQNILDSIKANADKVSSIDGKAKPLVVTQLDILNKEMATIEKLQEKASVEEYILRKYKIEMLPMDRLEEMKQQAADLLSTLAATESLYE